MVQAIRRTVTVGDDGSIQIRSPELAPGATAEVIVLLDGAPDPAPRLSEMIGSGKGGFSSPEEADAFLRMLRDEWDD